MPITNILAVLMRKWPLNSAVLAAVTHRRPGKVVDGTSTRVMTCMINRWGAKIDWKEIYNERDPPRMGIESEQKEKERITRGQLAQPCKPLQPSTEERRRTLSSSDEVPDDRISYFKSISLLLNPYITVSSCRNPDWDLVLKPIFYKFIVLG